MATVADACGNHHKTETERETTAAITVKGKLTAKEEIIPKALITIKTTTTTTTTTKTTTTTSSNKEEQKIITRNGEKHEEAELEGRGDGGVNEEEEDDENEKLKMKEDVEVLEVLYDSLELQNLPSAEISTFEHNNNANHQNDGESFLPQEGRNDLANGVDDNEDTVDNVAAAAAAHCQQLTFNDDIPEPIKVLDNIISEFETSSTSSSITLTPTTINITTTTTTTTTTTSSTTATTPTSINVKPAANAENQSEDDGYMSLSRKNMNKEGCEKMSANYWRFIPLDDSQTSSDRQQNKNNNRTNSKNNDSTATDLPTGKQKTIGQTTLPKIQRSVASANPSSYSSLPGCGNRPTDNRVRSGRTSINGERNVLGIDISAVHKAVLRGDLVKVPEPFPNEHPVTIYPGCSSPMPREVGGSRVKRNQRLLTSVEKHKEMCHILKPQSSTNNSSASTSPPTSCDSSASSNSKEFKADKIKYTHAKSTKSLNVQHKMRSASDDDDYSDLSVDQSLPTKTNSPEVVVAATPPMSNGHMGLAWEIHFQPERKKRAIRATKKGLTKPVQTTPIPQGNIKKLTNKCDKNMDKVDMVDSSQLEEEWIYDTDEKIKQHYNNHNNHNNNYNNNNNDSENMLGKGTFIIRRTTKKPVALSDVFEVPIVSSHHQSKKAIVGPTSIEGPASLKKASKSKKSSKDVSKKRELEFHTTKPQTRHSFDTGTSHVGSSVTSPRERLSLNLEAQQRNSLKRDDSLPPPPPPAVLMNNSSPIEDKVRSSRKINLKSHSLDSPLKRELGGECVVANYVDSSAPVYNYKSVSAVCHKNSDYVTDLRTSCTTTPHTDLAPTLEEDEEQYSDFSYSSAPLKQIENNISKLLRGDMSVMQPHGGDGMKSSAKPHRVLEFRPGVHKSESAKEMLLSQNSFGPLPPSPPLSNPALFDYDAPLPPSPHDDTSADEEDTDVPMKSYHKTTTAAEIHTPGRSYVNEDILPEPIVGSGLLAKRNFTDQLPPPPPSTPPLLIEELPPPPPPPIVPPHRGHSVNTIKSWSIDSNFKRRSPRLISHGHSITTTPTGGSMGGGGSLSVESSVGVPGGVNSMRYVSYGTKRSLRQSPREEHRLQTSFSLPETPIFARGSCDIPRTPFRRQTVENTVSGSRTAPRSNTSHSIAMGNSIVGITGGVAAGSAYSMAMCRQHSINHALVSNEMLRLSGAPARGWYPKQRSMRPASTENIDRLASIRFLDSGTGLHGTGARKPCTLPPNLTPSFLNKSPREALRRVTSLLIAKKRGNTKERKPKANNSGGTLERDSPYNVESNGTFPKEPIKEIKKESQANGSTPKAPTTKKKSIFKNLWKRSKHVSLDQ